MNTIHRLFNPAALGALSLVALSLGAPGQGPGTWDPATVDLFAHLPVQEGGRVKPLESVANFSLLGMHGKRSLITLEENKLTAMEWLLDALFTPEHARRQMLFKVPDSETVEAIGLAIPGKRKADRYSYDELGPGLQSLFQAYNQYAPLDRKTLSRVQGQLVDLAVNVSIFEQLISYMDFARHHFTVGDSPRLREMFDGRAVVHYSDVLAAGPELMGLWTVVQANNVDDPDRQAVEQLLNELDGPMRFSRKLALFPPDESLAERPVWASAGELGVTSLTGGGVSQTQLNRLLGFERLMDAQGDPAAFMAALQPLADNLVAAATRRGEYGQIGLEVTYYRLDLITWSLAFFFIAFLVVVSTWLRPRSRLLYQTGWWAALAANLPLTLAIVLRCIIRGRPPVSTLYETILFIVAVGVFVSLFIERVNRQKIALAVGAILGVVGLFMANKFELLEGPKDTMPVLQAVLDTNFWLATHVTCITIGYSAGLLAAGVGSFYLIAKLVGWRRGDKSFYKSIVRMTYGVVCFGLLFSLVGTILGGVWANDSWGRFWGWDPKENGALLIVLANLVILHGRMSGLLRDHGVCTAAAFTGTVVAFSWFHVNQLGVGLHSYGFTQGIANALWTYYLVQWGIMGLGFVAWMMARNEQRIRREVEAMAKAEGGGKPVEGLPA